MVYGSSLENWRGCKSSGGSNPLSSVTDFQFLNMITMEFYSVKHWQENFDELMDRVENGETIGIENDKGEKAVMVPADDEIIRIYSEMNNEAS